ncbi:hypothetical protein DSC45_01840 [Streptomyces sp. YIM 130001]|uniref:hypothetical protein n=1 Tax=Streptomyces sp. YIM 130001 TaxID=2259644 RepID=UPI000ED1DB80|nr:hypothetical protein [Streptomyces sp. YIM 130001]RII20844.1 hypothetical protein DSC45_01840 [Streptomyces sp. YIM 130001]
MHDRRRTGRRAALLAAALLALAVPAAVAADGGGGIQGGATFNSARPVQAGTLSGDTVVGDLYFYRVDLLPGQSLSVTARTTLPAGYNPGPEPEAFGVAVYDPVRQPARCRADSPTAAIWKGGSTAREGGSVEADCSLGVREDNDDAAELAGTYYIQAGITSTNKSRGDTLPLRLDIEIDDSGVVPDSAEPFEPGARGADGGGGAAARESSTDVQPAADARPLKTWGVPAATALTAAALGFALLAVLERRRHRRSAAVPPYPGGLR